MLGIFIPATSESSFISWKIPGDVYKRQVLEKLFKRLADLMPEAKTIGKLRMQGLSDDAIAKAIGIPRTTFLSRIQAAKKLLEQEYPDFF